MMAEFKNTIAQASQKASDSMTADGMAAFGKPVPSYRKSAALRHCRQMGLKDTNKAMGMINRAADAIERDEPYQAMEAIMAYLDLTGTYRLLAVLCTAEEPKKPEQEMVYEEWGF